MGVGVDVKVKVGVGVGVDVKVKVGVGVGVDAAKAESSETRIITEGILTNPCVVESKLAPSLRFRVLVLPSSFIIVT